MVIRFDICYNVYFTMHRACTSKATHAIGYDLINGCCSNVDSTANRRYKMLQSLLATGGAHAQRRVSRQFHE